ncbi:hypothetical protein ABVK25_004830 [Lepraria finkii]|uniref:DNA (cytosine-5-)-methyltransferase n=1 Tax=Lepraria finkii TaxID=1340010 RepID=A0ABR4BC53_9LECA
MTYIWPENETPHHNPGINSPLALLRAGAASSIHPESATTPIANLPACNRSHLAHKFGVSGVKKQIGNAVPPAVATVLLEGVKKALLKADGLL